MIIATHGIIASQLAGFDADAQAFFDRVTTAGGTLSATEKAAVNTLVLNLKSYSIWTKMKAIYPMVGASASACAQNLKSSSFTGTFNGGWTYSSTGATPNGTNGYMDTGFNAYTQLSAHSISLSYYSRTQSTNISAAEMGSSDATYTNQYTLDLYYQGVSAKVFVAGGYPTYSISNSNTDTLGYMICSRTANNSAKMFMDNVQIGSTLTTTYTGTFANRTMYIGAQNANGTAMEFTNRQCAFASIGDGITDTEASNFYTAVQAFQTTLSRNV